MRLFAMLLDTIQLINRFLPSRLENKISRPSNITDNVSGYVQKIYSQSIEDSVQTLLMGFTKDVHRMRASLFAVIGHALAHLLTHFIETLGSR